MISTSYGIKCNMKFGLLSVLKLSLSSDFEIPKHVTETSYTGFFSH